MTWVLRFHHLNFWLGRRGDISGWSPAFNFGSWIINDVLWYWILSVLVHIIRHWLRQPSLKIVRWYILQVLSTKCIFTVKRLRPKIRIAILLLLDKINGLFKLGMIKEWLRLSILILIESLLYLIWIFSSAICHSFYKIGWKIALVYIWQLFQRDNWRKQKIWQFFNSLFYLDFWLRLDDSCLYRV
jgi:hypothetical protein